MEFYISKHLHFNLKALQRSRFAISSLNKRIHLFEMDSGVPKARVDAHKIYEPANLPTNLIFDIHWFCFI